MNWLTPRYGYAILLSLILLCKSGFLLYEVIQHISTTPGEITCTLEAEPVETKKPVAENNAEDGSDWNAVLTAHGDYFSLAAPGKNFADLPAPAMRISWLGILTPPPEIPA